MTKRLFIVFVLGFSSGLPMALVSSTLQAWFAAAGMSVLATGMLSLIGLPYAYRMLWAPIVDRWQIFQIGKRRSWILSMQIILLIGFNGLAWCSPLQTPHLMAIIAVLLAFFSATQDIAIDAHRTEYLLVTEHAMGASLAVFGYRLAMLISGGLALVIAHAVGWSITYHLMGLLMIPGMIVTFLSPEPSHPAVGISTFRDTFVEPVKSLFAQRGIISLLLFIFFYKLGEAFTATTSGVMMPFLIQGLGFSLGTVGVVNKVVGVIALLAGGLMSGIVLLRWSLSKALLCFGIVQALTNIFFIVLAIAGKQLNLFVLAVISDNIAAGMGTTALVALMMRLVDKRYTATQFSILVSISALPRIFSGPLAALFERWFGWTGLFELSFILALLFIPFLSRVQRNYLREPDVEMAVDVLEDIQVRSIDKVR